MSATITSPQGDTKSSMPTVRRALLTVVAPSSAILSATATHAEVLRLHAIADPLLAWLAVAVFEGGALYLALTVHDQRLRRGTKSGRPSQEWLGFWALTLIAVSVNVTHAASIGAGFWGMLLGGTLPLILLLLLHSAWGERGERAQADHEARERERADAAAAVALAQAEAELELARLATERERLAAEKAERDRVAADERERRARERRERPVVRAERTPVSGPSKAASGGDTTPAGDQEDRLALVAEWLAADPGITGKTVGERLEASEQTGRRLLAKVRVAA